MTKTIETMSTNMISNTADMTKTDEFLYSVDALEDKMSAQYL